MRKKLLTVILPVLLLCAGLTQAQTTVNSLEALLPYLNDDNANIKLAPGTYTITAADIQNGTFGNPRFLFEGNNSTYDFTGVTINIAADVYTENHGMNHIQILGNNNVLLNLTLVDLIDEYYNVKKNGGTSIIMDGQGNRIEGFHVTTKGSYPYGYGDAFGKGGKNNTIGHKKHSACLIRGESNHLKNCTFIHRSYGHCIFMQAANNALIEGCYVEGEMRSTDDMLAEEGTGSPADNIDFLTTWGYRLPAGYMMSTGEEGIRAYNAGTTFINGETIQRGTSNPTVRNCTVKYMRGGVTLAHASGTVRAENCIAIGNEQGFGLGSGTAINCKSDVAYGHAFKSTYNNDSWDLDIEIIPAEDPYYNGQKCVAFIGMNNSILTIKGGDPNLPADYRIQVGGVLNGVRFHNGNLDHQSTHDGKNNMVVNNTPHTIRIASGSEGNTIETCGRVEDYSTNNTITASSSCALEIPCNNTFDELQAECYDSMFEVGVQDIAGSVNEKEVYAINHNDWIGFQNIDLTGVTAVKATASSTQSGASIEVRSGSTTGTLLGSIPIGNTSSQNNYQEFTADLTQTLEGETDIYFIFKGGSGWLFNLDKINFIQSACYTSSYQASATVDAKDYCEAAGVTTTTNSSAKEVVTDINNGDYIRFANVDFEYFNNINSIEFFASSATNGGTIEVRSGAINGTLLATVGVKNTGGWNQYEAFSSLLSSEITGIHDLYFVFTGASGHLFDLDWFHFKEETLDNLALATNGGIATQSSTAHGGVASRAIDGNTNGNFGGGSVTHTADGGEGVIKWWQVDLGDNKIINEVVIYNRTGYESRLNNYTVEIKNSNGEVVYSQLFPGYPNPVASIYLGNVVGRTVRVSKTSNRALTIAEVEVYGTDNTLSVNTPAFDVIKLYPNPASDLLNIKNALDTTLEVYNVQGVLEMTVNISTNQKTISLGNLSSGIHFLKFTNKEGSVVKKLIKR